MAAQTMGLSDGLGTIVDQVAQEKGIDRQVLIETMEAAILKAAQAAFGPTRELEARFNSDTGNIDLFQYMTVVEAVTTPEREIALDVARKHGLEAEVGEELGFQVFWHPRDADRAKQQDKEFGSVLDMKQARSTFGRIAAQAAKQVLLQRVRDAERDIIYNEYKDRQGQLIRGIVRRFEKGHNLIVDLGKTEGVLPAREQTRVRRSPGRPHRGVREEHRSRRARPDDHPFAPVAPPGGKAVEASPGNLRGIVKIGASHASWFPQQIAVTSRDSDVDPVGACVGIKGSRVQAVVQELRGEKIDIVPWDKDPARYIINAIQPAEVNKVIVDEADHRMELVVPEEKLSLAIGRKGQNVRLASQLTSWKLDIISEAKFLQMEEEALVQLREIEGIGDDLAKSMYRLGFRALEEVAEASVEELVTIDGIEVPERAEELKAAAEAAMERVRQERIERATSRVEPLGEEEKLRFLQGIGQRTAQMLEEAGYRRVEDLSREDPDRLAIRTGLGIKKARQIHESARHFLTDEWKVIEEARARHASEGQETQPGE